MTPHAALDPSVPAVVLNLDPYAYHHGQLGAVRSLGRAGVPTWAAVADGRFPVTRSRHLAGTVLWNASTCDDDELVAGLLAIGERLGRYVPVAVDDRLATVLAARADELRPALLLPDVPKDLPRRCADKAGLARLCRDHGIGTPMTAEVVTDEDVTAFVDEAGAPPYVVKVARPWEVPAGRSLPRTSVVDEAGLRALTRDAGVPLVAQQYVTGGDAASHAYVDRHGEVAFLGTAVKTRSLPPGRGPTVAGRAQHLPEVAAATLALLAATGWRGGVDLDFRTTRDGRPLLVDVNPRQGAQSRLFERVDGLDLARALHLDMTGRPVGTGPQLVPKAFRVELDELRVARHYLRQDGLAALRGGPGRTEWAWWAADDVRPFLALVRDHTSGSRRHAPAGGPRTPQLQPR